MTAEQLKAAFDVLTWAMDQWQPESDQWSNLVESRRLIEAEAARLGCDTDDWH